MAVINNIMAGLSVFTLLALPCSTALIVAPRAAFATPDLIPRAAFATPRAAAALSIQLPAPPAPPPTHVDDGHGGGGDESMLLTDVSLEQRRAILSLWKFTYEMDCEIECDTDADILSADFMSHWVGHLAPSGWMGALRGRTLGAYLSSNLNSGGQPEALIAVRYERDTSHWRHIIFGRHVMVVDEVLLSPHVPEQLRALLHAVRGVRARKKENRAAPGPRDAVCAARARR